MLNHPVAYEIIAIIFSAEPFKIFENVVVIIYQYTLPFNAVIH